MVRVHLPEKLEGDEPEELEVVPWRLDQLHELVQREDVTEGRSIAALFLARAALAAAWRHGDDEDDATGQRAHRAAERK